MVDDDKSPDVEKLSEEDLDDVSGGLVGPPEGGLGEAWSVQSAPGEAG